MHDTPTRKWRMLLHGEATNLHLRSAWESVCATFREMAMDLEIP